MNLYCIPKKTSNMPVLYIFLAAAATAAVSYFLYDWFGQFPFLGYIFPATKSIWEQSKLCFYPLLLVWLISWCIWLRNEYSFSSIVLSASSSSAVCLYHTILGYYALRYGLSLSGFAVDLSLLFTGILLGLYLSFYLLHHGAKASYRSYLYLFTMTALFTVFTAYPPALPLFQNP